MDGVYLCLPLVGALDLESLSIASRRVKDPFKESITAGFLVLRDSIRLLIV